MAIVGAGLGGLAVAALSCIRRKRVLVLEGGDSLKCALGVYESGGFAFSPAPSISYGFEPDGIFQEMALLLSLQQNTFTQTPCYQVALPDRRVTVFADWNKTLEELRREFPGEIDSAAKFYRTLHKEALVNAKSRLAGYIARYRSAAGFIGSYRFSREFSAFLELQSMFFFGATLGELPFNSLIAFCTTPPQRLSGGFTRFAEQLHEVIMKHGSEVRFNEPNHELVAKGRGIVGIKTIHGIITSDIILLNQLRRQNSAVLYLGVKNEVLPVGMCRDVLVMPDYARPRAYYSLCAAGQSESASPEGMSALTVSFCHDEKGTDEPGDAGRNLDLVSRIVPFLSGHVVMAKEGGDERGWGAVRMPDDITFKQYMASRGLPLLFKGSKKRLYLLRNERQAPRLELSAAKKFVQKMY